MTVDGAGTARQRLVLPKDWKIEEFADPELLTNSEGYQRVVERERAKLRRRKAEIAAERARRG